MKTMQKSLETNVYRVALLALLIVAAPAALAQRAPVTSEGFDALAEKTTLYLPVRMDGVMGVDCPAKGVNHALKAAADDPAIQHAVFMIDSEEGWPLQRDEVGDFKGKLEITAVVHKALAPAVFPVFFADHIYMTDTALIGGLPLHLFVPDGSEDVTAKQVGIFSSMLASAAQANGHDPAIAHAFVNHKLDLYYWREDGKPVLSNNKPENPQSLEGFRKLKTAVPSGTIVLDQRTSIEIGFAKPIDAFDEFVVGEYLGKPNWLPANHFGRVCSEIGYVIEELKQLREEISDVDKMFPQIKGDRRNRSDEDEGYKAFKKNMDEAVQTLDVVTDALEALYKVHPERHAYFAGPDGRTILADAERWDRDVAESLKQFGLASTRLRSVTDDFDQIGGDAEYLYDVNQRMRVIGDHLQGIRRHGNAAYWRDHAEPDLPDDIYG